MGIGQKGYELAAAKDAQKSIIKKMRSKHRSCLWLCFSNVELGSVVQEDERGEKSALEKKSCTLMCCSSFVANKRG
ncbi:hypothetical protein ACJRO7_023251 [Eucalyptus globulus]|uniref:Uncharacterized protein n=1 Tax=Eucalyptus globulus TaxID=34317 RepID=A0ABD3K716_EUCGL